MIICVHNVKLSGKHRNTGGVKVWREDQVAPPVLVDRTRVLFVLLNRTPLLSSGFALVTHMSARIFFILFHIVVVIVIIK